jgi:hypothetical protein
LGSGVYFYRAVSDQRTAGSRRMLGVRQGEAGGGPASSVALGASFTRAYNWRAAP